MVTGDLTAYGTESIGSWCSTSMRVKPCVRSIGVGDTYMCRSLQGWQPCGVQHEPQWPSVLLRGF